MHQDRGFLAGANPLEWDEQAYLMGYWAGENGEEGAQGEHGEVVSSLMGIALRLGSRFELFNIHLGLLVWGLRIPVAELSASA